MDATAVLGTQGRLVITLMSLKRSGWSPVTDCTSTSRLSRLTSELRPDAVAELRRLAGDVPESRTLVGELLAERRLETETE